MDWRGPTSIGEESDVAARRLNNEGGGQEAVCLVCLGRKGWIGGLLCSEFLFFFFV